MASTVADRLTELGLTLPPPPQAVANYVPAVQAGDLLFVSGQLPMRDGALVAPGTLGAGVTIEEGQEAARRCAVNGLAVLAGWIGNDWARLKRVVKVGGFVACAPAFTDHPKVINGASDLLVEVLGERGRHARAAVGVSSLPLGASVEVEFVFQLETEAEGKPGA